MIQIIAVLLIVIIASLFFGMTFRIGTESFESPAVSSEVSQGEGASEYYGWGYQPIESRRRHPKQIQKRCPKCEKIYIDEHVCNIVVNHKDSCKTCDITQHPDIDKYVLKSSVPPCPDMSRFATKSMLQPMPDMSKYILKTEIPPMPDMSRYMLKSQCVPPPQPTHQPSQHVDVYHIENHPDFNRYISKDACKQYKKSWIQNFEEWWEHIFQRNNNTDGNGQNGLAGRERHTTGFPMGYSFSPYAGYGTDNPGYNLDGSQ